MYNNQNSTIIKRSAQRIIRVIDACFSHNMALIIMLLLAIAIFCSCGTMEKNKSSLKLKADIASGHTLDSIRLAKLDSIRKVNEEILAFNRRDSGHSRTEEASEEEVITVNLRKPPVNSATQVSDTTKPPPGTRPTNDYAGAPQVHDIEVDGHHIHSNQPIESVNIKNKKGSRTIDATKLQVVDSNLQKRSDEMAVHKYDSAGKKEKDTTHTTLDIVSKDKKVERTGLSVAGYAFITGGIVLLFFGGRFLWLRRKRRQEQEALVRNKDSGGAEI